MATTISSHSRCPPCAGARLEHAWSPGGNCELPTRTHHTPKLPNLLDHVGHEENRKNAHDSIECGVWKSQRLHIRQTKFNIMKLQLARLHAGQLEKPLG